jgi:hypothetical protein
MCVESIQDTTPLKVRKSKYSTMFLINVTIGQMVLERTLFRSFREAEKWAKDRKQDKVCRIDHMVFMGDPVINIYELKSRKVTSGHIDKPVATI